jgi:RNA polymerase sigma-70 factor, ECF subfamily
MSSSMEIENHSEEEKSLIRCVVAGESPKFELLVNRYQQRIFAVLFAMLGNRQDAEDVTQSAFVTAFRKLDKFENRSSFYTWLHRIAFHQAIDLQRKKARTTKRHMSQDISESMHDASADLETPATIAVKNETAMQIQFALSKLANDQRNIIVLRDLQGMDYAEIASTLDLPIGTVRSRLHRARLELRDLLKSAGLHQTEGSPS